MRARSWSLSDVGLVRSANEDCLLADDERGLYVIADGLGGQAAGDIASQIAVQTLAQVAPKLRILADHADVHHDEKNRRAVFDQLQQAVERANQEIFERAHSDAKLSGMMTTLTTVLLANRAAFVAHVGDSRVYLSRTGALDQLTMDHTLAEELVRVGRLERDDVSTFRFRNVVARALGEKATVQIDLFYVDLRSNDRLILCSDGLSDYVKDRKIAELVHSNTPAKSLVEAANGNGGGDNVSVVVVDVLEASSADKTTTVPSMPAMEHTEKVTVLGGLYFCQHLTEDERLKVLRYVHEVNVAAGQHIVREGERSDDFYLCVKGRAEVCIDGIRVNEIRGSGHFGEIALVSGQARSATVTAISACHLFRLSRDGFYDLSQKDQAIAVKMLWAISQSLAQRVTELSHQVVSAQRS